MDLVAEARQLEVANHFGPQEAGRIGEARETDPREHRFRDARPADDRTPLQDENLEAGLREMRRRDEAVVTAAHDDRIPQAAHGLRSTWDICRVTPVTDIRETISRTHPSCR